MDDLDDMLGDLLDDGPPKKETPQRRAVNKPNAASRPGPGGKAKPSVFDDEFYSNLAAGAGDSDLSEVSDADPAAIVDTMDDLDDLDAQLFGKKPSLSDQKLSSTIKEKGSNKTDSSTTRLSSTLPAKKKGLFDSDSDSDKGGGKQSKSSIGKAVGKSGGGSYNSFDEDDPLAGLLSDEEDDIKTKTPLKPKPSVTKSVENTPPSSSGSRRQDIDRPPTRSGSNKSVPKQVKKDDFMFDDDDDDVLGGMGLESPREEKKAVSKSSLGDDHRPGGAKSILSDLLGGGSEDASKLLERPGTGERRIPTALDQVLGGTSSGSRTGSAGAVKKKDDDEEVNFGSYMPSAASSRPSSKRSVRFDDDDFFSERPKSNPPRGRKAPGSVLEDMINKDDRDWLDMASGSDAARPASAGHVLDRGSKENVKTQGAEKPGTAPTEAAPPVDWLGLARLGSPEHTPRTQATDKPKKSRWEESDEEEPVRQKPPTSSAKGNDKNDDDWLGLGESKAAPKEDLPKSSKGTDWLGFDSDSEKGDDKLPFKGKTNTNSLGTKPVTKDLSDGWLDDDEPAAKKVDDFLDLGEEVNPDEIIAKTTPKANWKSENLFETPASGVSSSLPWEKGSRSRPDKSPEIIGQSSDDHLDAILKEKQGRRQSPQRAAGTVTTPAGPANTPAFTSPLSADVLKQQDLAFHQQQMQMKQQADQQAELQRQFLAQQEAMKQQLQKQQQQMMERTMASFSQPMGMPPSFGGWFGEDLESKMKKIEQEKEHLKLLLETTKIQHQEQLKIIEDSAKKQVSMLEEMFSQRENRLRQENELLCEQAMNRQRQYDEERTYSTTQHIKKLQDLELVHRDEVSALREQHRAEMSQLSEEHKNSVQRLRTAKDQEVEAVINASNHTRMIQDVIHRVGEREANLSELQSQVASIHTNSLTSREKAASDRDQQLKTLQERLERQCHDNEVERARLMGLVNKLETQLTEQARDLEESKWRYRQEETRLKTLQESVKRERQEMLEQVARERSQLEREKTTLLEEQRSILSNLQKERRALADERAEFNLEKKLKHEQEQHDMVRTLKNTSELDANVKALHDGQQKLTARSAELDKQAQGLATEKAKLEQEAYNLRAERDRLEGLAMTLRQRSQDIDDACNLAAMTRDEGQQALMVAKKTEAEQNQRIAKIQAEMNTLRVKEKQIAEERLALAKEKQQVEQSAGQALCVSCRTPVRDQNAQQHVLGPTQGPSRFTSAAQNLYHSLPVEAQKDVVSNLSAAIDRDRSVRMWRISADKDKEFLEEENYFLQAIKHAPYNVTAAETDK